MENLIIIFVFFITFETFLIVSIKILKKDFKWLLNSEDEFPFFSKKRLNKFYKETYDPVIGWDRKKNKTGFEFGEKKTFFQISKKGYRGKSRYKKTQI